MGESKKIGKKVRDLNKENGVGSMAIKKRLMEKRKDFKKKKHMREREKSELEGNWGFQRGL